MVRINRLISISWFLFIFWQVIASRIFVSGEKSLPLLTPSRSQFAKSREYAMNSMNVRLGSGPPNCRNKCSTCSPCVAVQLPTPQQGSTATVPLPSRDQVFSSNYKPEGWKCKCKGKLFNP